jgi:aromatic ring-opening dioxygenase LigB subunit
MLVVVLDAKLAAPFSHPTVDYHSKYINCNNIQKVCSLKQINTKKKTIKLCTFGKKICILFLTQNRWHSLNQLNKKTTKLCMFGKQYASYFELKIDGIHLISSANKHSSTE